jgi:hypothetical protein
VNVILLGQRIFVVVIKDLEMRSSWIAHVGPESSDRCLYKKKRNTEKDRDGGRDWSGVATSQGTLSLAGSYQKLGMRHGAESSSGLLERSNFADTLCYNL